MDMTWFGQEDLGPGDGKEAENSTSSRNEDVLTSVQVKRKVKVTQSCSTLFNPMGYTIHGILQARILE